MIKKNFQEWFYKRTMEHLWTILSLTIFYHCSIVKSDIRLKIWNHLQSTDVDAVVFRGLSARDPDSNVNGQVEYFIENENESPFKIDLPHQGIVRLAKPLDYESQRIHFVTIVARVCFLVQFFSFFFTMFCKRYCKNLGKQCR